MQNCLSEVLMIAVIVCLTLCVIALAIVSAKLYRRIIAVYEQMCDFVSELSSSVVDIEEKLATLEVNSIEDETPENEKAVHEAEMNNARYNEGMDNIFNYTVNSGIRMDVT